MPVPKLDFSTSEYEQQQYDLIRKLRAENWYAESETGRVFFNQEDAKYFLGDENFRFSYYYIDAERSPYLADRVQGMLLAKHGHDHARLRALVLRALRDRVVNQLQQSIQGIVDDLIRSLPESGETELIGGFADRVPERVLGPMLGIDYQKASEMDEWIRASAKSIDTIHADVDLEAIEHGWRQLEIFLADLLDARRGQLGDDIFSELIRAEIDGDRMSAEELTGITMELARAGVETTRNQLALILYQLLHHPEQWQRLQADPGLVNSAVEEGMRYAPLPHVIPQQAVNDLDYKDIRFKAGDIALVLVPAANRDPAVFDDADVFDVAREPRQHFSFGHGTHFCPGANLARMELRIALASLARHVRSWRLIDEPEKSGASSGSVPRQLRVQVEVDHP